MPSRRGPRRRRRGWRKAVLPTSLVEKADNLALMELNRIILKACEADARLRYHSAGEMHADLLTLQKSHLNQ